MEHSDFRALEGNIMAAPAVRKSVQSADNTSIDYWEYRSRGSIPSKAPKPGLLILHDGFDSSSTYKDMALALWTSFDVYVPDRRGRGYSGPYRPNSNLQTEINDLKALLGKTGAQNILGVGSGAVIALHAALQVAATTNFLIRKIAAFEPATIPGGVEEFREQRDILEQQVDGSNVTDPRALETAMNITQTGSLKQQERRSIVPRWLSKRWSDWRSKQWAEDTLQKDESRKGTTYSLGRLLGPLKGEIRSWEEISRRFEALFRLNQLNVEIFLMGGSESPNHFKENIRDFRKLLARARYTQFGGMDHLGLSNTADGGDPERVAIHLRKFFLDIPEEPVG
jgi:pimeloyl-ACP methyl ester carboxylesterase